MDDERKDPITKEEIDLEEHEEPVTTGTVFLTLIFLMMIFGFWMMMYLILIER